MQMGTVIRKTIRKQGKTQQWIAEQLGMDHKTFSGKLSRNSITDDELLKIAALLDVNLEDMNKQLSSPKKPITNINMFRKKDDVVVSEEACVIEESAWLNVKEKMIRLAVQYTENGEVEILEQMDRIQINFNNYDGYYEKYGTDLLYSFLIGFKANGIDNDKIIQNISQDDFEIYRSIWRLDILPEGNLQKLEFYEVVFDNKQIANVTAVEQRD